MTFTYTARTSAGQSISGSVTAETMTAAIQQLRAEGKFPIAVTPAEQGGAAVAKAAASPRGMRIPRADLIHFCTQLSIMVETGVVLSDALDCIARQSEKPVVKALIEDISGQVQSGVNLSDAMARHPRSFPVVFIALIRAAEKSGMLAAMLNRAKQYLRDEQETRRKVQGAMMYPSIMLGFAVVTTIFLLAFVLPRFTVIYATKAAALPLPTKILMGMSDVLVGNWLALLVGVGMAVGGLMLAARTEVGRRIGHYIQIHAPLFGSLYKKAHLARGLRMIGTMGGAGVSLMECVETAYDLCPNVYFRDLWKSASDQIQTGRQLSDPLFGSPLVPRAIAQMIFSGEKSGKLSAVMEQIAGFSEQELKDQISNMTRYIEPLMIVIMGIIIGSICLALLLPIFTISKVMAS